MLLPAWLSGEDEDEWVSRMLDRLAAKERRRRPTDEALLARAKELSVKYLDGKNLHQSDRLYDPNAPKGTPKVVKAKYGVISAGVKNEDEGLYPVQHGYWLKTMQDALAREEN